MRAIILGALCLAGCGEVIDTYQREKTLDLTPPEPSQASEIVDEVITLTIVQNNEFLLNDEPIELDGLDGALEAVVAGNDNVKINVRAHPKAKNRLVLIAVEAANGAGSKHSVGFEVLKDE